MMRISIYFSLLVLSVMQLCCQNPSGTSQPTQIFENLSASEFKKLLSEKEGVQLVDVRTPGEFADRHLENAVLMDINDPNFSQSITALDKNKPVFVYCLAGGRSSNAAGIMKDAGFKEVYNLTGGLTAWNAAGYPVASGGSGKEPKTLSPDEFTKQVSVSEFVLVDYHAKWCGPCKKIAPILDKVVDERKSKLSLLKIDADEYPSLLKEKGIASIPYLELYKQGKLVWKHIGYIDEADLLKETGL